MPATLRLTREGTGIELRRGLFEILVDGKSLGSIKYQETFEAPVEPGHHDLRIQAGRYSSRNESFDTADGQTVSFRCHGGAQLRTASRTTSATTAGWESITTWDDPSTTVTVAPIRS